MRSLALLLLLITLCGSAAAQKKSQGEESELLNWLAEVAGAKSVVEAKAGALPAGEPLKVYVLAPEQADLWYKFLNWVEEWNRTEGAKYGRVTVVEDASRADVVVARFLTSFKTKSEQSDEVLGTSAITDTRQAPDLRRPSPVILSRHSRSISRSAKVYGYILAREGEGLKLLWRTTDTARDNPKERRPPLRPGQLKGGKDSKIAGDSLRDQFFKLLRARPKPAAAPSPPSKLP